MRVIKNLKIDDLHFRPIAAFDYEQIIILWKKTKGIGLSNADTETNFNRFLKRNPSLSYVCKYKNEIVGTILCGHDGRRGYIYHLAVSERFRRKGIGDKLISLSLKKLRRSGIDKCHLFLYVDNNVAIHFYEKTGWQRRNELLIYSKDL